MVKALNAERNEIPIQLEVKAELLDHPEVMKRPKYWEAPEFYPMDSMAYNKMFPLDQYGSEHDPSAWPIRKQVLDVLQEGDVLEIDKIQTLSQGAYKISLSAKDSKGNHVSKETYLYVSRSGERAIPVKPLWVSGLQKSYAPGEALNVSVSTPFASAKIIYKVHYTHTNIESGWLTADPQGVINLPITESHRGGMSLDIGLVKNNRIHQESFDINVPWDNKDLVIEYETFRDKLQPGEEEKWTLILKDKKGKLVDGQLLAAMYDKSLDQFLPFDWKKQFFPIRKAYSNWNGAGFKSVTARSYAHRIRTKLFSISGFSPQLMPIRLGGSRQAVYARGRSMEEVHVKGAPSPMMAKSAPEAGGFAQDNSLGLESATDVDAVTIVDEDNVSTGPDISSYSVRENLKETVFFYPDIEVKNGQAQLEFTMNEALTKWNLMLFGYNKELQYVFDTKEILTQKELMIEPLLPRFVRQGDEIFLNAKVSNLSGATLKATTQIQIYDAITDEVLDNSFLVNKSAQTMSLASGESKIVDWQLVLPLDYTNPIKIKMIAQGGGHSDGEQSVIPVLTNRMLVTETMPMFVPQGVKKTFEMDGLDKLGTSNSLQSENFTVEMTLNPAWIVAKAIPFLTAKKGQSSRAIFDAINGNMLMAHLLKQQPQIKSAISMWKEADLKSPLRKNEDLKLNSLEETPWLRDAISEEETMSQLSLFLDNNYVANQLSSLSNELKNRQYANGGFSWIPDGRDNWYVTQNILEGIGHLRKVGVTDAIEGLNVHLAVQYIDDRLVEHYNKRGSQKNKFLKPLILHYLYVRSFFPEIPLGNKTAEAVDHYYEKGHAHWQDSGSYLQGMLALAAHRTDRSEITQDVMTSLSERMIRDESIGNYWNDQAGYYWYNLDVEKQAMMIELYQEIGADSDIIDGLKLFLLRSKQTNSWKTAKSTSAACYAFLLDSDNWLAQNVTTSISFPQLDQELMFGAREMSTGYIREDIPKENITVANKAIEIDNPSETAVWGAVYWQYYEDLDKIESLQDSPLTLTKEVYKVAIGDNGEELVAITENDKVKPGDRLRVRIHLSVDRLMEFVEMKDMRSSGTEPVNVLSQYKYQDGLGYYESTKDLVSYFYFSRLPKGNWVFEYDVKAVHLGSFTNGITQIQSVYAPEFSAHSNGINLEIVNR